jgi:predicted nucleic acid-binding protein
MMMTPMTKTQVYLPDEDLEALHRIAKERGRPVADLIREAIRKVWVQPTVTGPVALWDGPAAATSVDHDRVVYDALALTQDPLHDRALAIWTSNEAAGTRWCTSVPVVLETFTFLARAVSTELALAWKDSLATVKRLTLLECGARDLGAAWTYFDRRELHRLSAVDATSFALMAREHLRWAFSFDTLFGTAGFEYLG